ncbi:MAG TPA: hypothetical protein VN903_27665 [Polyangia bacterium]|jgi:hypothetical protein|nr:hypothetical protein [Polyangia bacterium]
MRNLELEYPLVRAAALLGCLGVLLAVYFSIARPWFRRWGATDAEVSMPLPGDEIVPAATSSETRAITIGAPARDVWPWLAQMGQDRGGFYSYDVLENLFGCEMPSVDWLDPRLQRWKLGDKMWMYPPRKAGGIGFAVLTVYQPGRALGFATRALGASATAPPAGSWSFVVQQIDGVSSRLLFRGRAIGPLRSFAALFNVAVFEPVHFAMERRTMEGIKALAEGRTLSPVRDGVQVALWAILFVAFMVSGALVLAGRHVGRHLITFTAAGFLFQLLTLTQPSPLIGIALLLATVRPQVVLRSYRRMTDWHAS